MQASGKKLERLCAFLEGYSKGRIKIFLAVPAFDLRYLKSKYRKVELLTQHLDDSKSGSSTGALVPDIAKTAGASGSILNHSEHPLKMVNLANLVARLREQGMISIVCANSVQRVSSIAAFGPDFIAIEPPELIGTGRAVSNYSPAIIARSRDALESMRSQNSKTKLLCGAGIVNGQDARRAIELGSEGVLVASGVVLAKSPKRAIDDLLRGIGG